jgi:TetR/AcrR family fatty acid metabolism transcriptional regulator
MDKSNVAKHSGILKAALTLFSEKGFDRTTVDEIASRAGVGKGTIYLYFETKENILWTAIEEGLSRMGQVFEQIAQEKLYAQQLKQMIWAHFYFVQNNQELFEILYKEQLRFPKKEGIEDRLLQIPLKIHRQFTQLIQDGMRQNYLRPGDPTYFSAALAGILSHLAFHWLFKGKTETLATIVDTALSLFLAGAENKRS